MSEYDQHDVERRKEPAPEAVVHPGHFSPWLWVIPAVAVFFVGYLIVRYGFFGGGDITVRFADARGLDRYSPVRFRGAKVGTVQRITVDDKLQQVVVRIAMDASMTNALRTGTRFWIEEPSLEGGGVGGLLAGTSVGVAPGPGDKTSEFKGQEYAPVLTPPEAGKTFILESHGLGSFAVGSPVQFHGIKVGAVLGAEYDEAQRVTAVHAFVVQRFADHVRASSTFWRAGGLSFSLSGSGVSMGGASLASLLSAPIEFYTPEVIPGPPAPNGARFELFDSQTQAEAAAGGPQVTYVVYFTGSVGGLQPGTPVQMRGVPVGRVRDVRLMYIPQNATLQTPVTIEIDPRKLEMPVSDLMAPADLRAQMNDAMAKLVAKGMRATIASSLVLPGASGISLDFVARPGSGQLALNHEPPIIPAAQQADGLQGALAAVNELAGRIRNLPIEEIVGHLRSTATRIDQLVHDPALDQSIQRLNRSLADVEKVTATARENVGPIATNLRKASADAADVATTAKENAGPVVQSLRNAAASAEAAAKSAQQLAGSSQYQGYDLGNLVKELTQAAESIKALATYLEEHPDSLLKGRGK